MKEDSEEVSKKISKKKRSTSEDDQGKACHQPQDQGTAGNDDRHTQRKAKDNEIHIALCGGGNGDRIVETHDKIGDDDGAHSAHQIWRLFDGTLVNMVVLEQQLHPDPQQ